MFRYIYHGQVFPRQFREFFEAYEKFEKKLREKEYAPSQPFSPVLGVVNEVSIVIDYESLEQFQKENDAFSADAEIMSLYREMGTHFDGYPHDEIWQSATQIA